MPRRSDLSVLKVGGSLLNEEASSQLIEALAPFLKKNSAVLVHGGGKEITAWAARLGLETRFVNGRRYTDENLMEVVEMVLSGKVNPNLVAHLNQLKVKALGLSGRDGELVRAKRVPELGMVGIPSAVQAQGVRKILSAGWTPVFASIASDGQGEALNVNADEMASALAEGLRASRLILFTDVPGILDQDKKTIPAIPPDLGKKLIRDGVITGGMIPKMQSAFRALQKGVKEVWILEGKLPLESAKGTVLSKARAFHHPFI